MTAGWLASRRPFRGWVTSALLLGCVALIPDLDLLWGAHHEATHSLVAITAAGVIAALVDRSLAAPVAAAYGSHVLLDLLGADSTPPIGVMLFWPFSQAYIIAPWTPFPAISRRYWLPGFWVHNARAMLFELAVLGPLALVGWWISIDKNPDRSCVRDGPPPPCGGEADTAGTSNRPGHREGRS
jgi:membrane-bound metal-dependent hydrolase YbcI (DUF457 family)